MDEQEIRSLRATLHSTLTTELARIARALQDKIDNDIDSIARAQNDDTPSSPIAPTGLIAGNDTILSDIAAQTVRGIADNRRSTTSLEAIAKRIARQTGTRIGRSVGRSLGESIFNSSGNTPRLSVTQISRQFISDVLFSRRNQ